MSDYYSILGVQRNANQEEIKRAYRRLAAQHHPDRGGDTQKFQEIQAAYDTLSNPEKKSAYDNPQPQMHGFPGGFHFHTGGGFPPGFEEIFGDAFGGMFRRQQPRNRSLNIQTSITLLDAFTGKDLIANLKLPSGREQLVEVKIPAGINNGMTIKLSGLGDDSIPNVPRGDLHLTVHVEPHHLFERHGDDLVHTIDVNCLDAILGKKINVTTIDNKLLDVLINPGTQHGQTFAIQNYGMPNINNSNIRGRLLLNVNIIVPTNLTNSQKDSIRNIL